MKGSGGLRGADPAGEQGSAVEWRPKSGLEAEGVGGQTGARAQAGGAGGSLEGTEARAAARGGERAGLEAADGDKWRPRRSRRGRSV
jgi:hypothetical protein